MKNYITLIAVCTLSTLTACGGGGGGGGSTTPAIPTTINNQAVDLSNPTATAGETLAGLASMTGIKGTTKYHRLVTTSKSVANDDMEILLSGYVNTDNPSNNRMYFDAGLFGEVAASNLESSHPDIAANVDGNHPNNGPNRTYGYESSAGEGYIQVLAIANYMALASWETATAGEGGNGEFGGDIISIGMGIIGIETGSDIVAAKTGSADYNSVMAGTVAAANGNLYEFNQGGFNVNADFSSGVVAGTSAAINQGGLSMPSGIDFNGNISGNKVNGTVTANNVTIEGGNIGTMNGGMNLGFYGPDAEQMGGAFSMTGGGAGAVGIVGGQR